MPAADTSGSATVTVAVTDDRGRSATASFVFTVTPPPQVSKTIGPDGGEVGFDDGRFKITIPPGALGNDTAITISELSGNDIPAELRDSSVQHVYRMEPDGLQFIIPATVAALVPGSFPPPDGAPIIGFASDSNGTLELLSPLTDTVGTDGLTASAPLSHFSSVAQVVSKGVSVSFSVSPTQVPVGSGFTLTLEVKSTADSTVDGTLLSGLISKPDIVILAGGNFDPPSLQLDPYEAQDIVHTLDGTCEEAGTGGFGLLLSSEHLTGLLSEEIVGGQSISLQYRRSFQEFSLNNIEVECTALPPPPPGTSAPPVPVGLYGPPATQGNPIGEAVQILASSPLLSGLLPLFGPLTSDGGPIAAFSSANGAAIIDLATRRVLKDMTSSSGAAPLYGFIGLSQDPPGADSAAALVAFGPSFGSQQLFPFFPGETDFDPVLNYFPLETPVYDAWPIGGETVSDGAAFTAPYFGVGFIRFDPANPADGYRATNETLRTGFVAAPYSAYVAAPGGPALILADRGSGLGGILVLNDRSGGVNGGNTTLVGPVGEFPRKLRCRANICAVTNFTDDTLSIVLWDGFNGATIIGTTPVGDGPVDLDLVLLDNGNVGVVSTGFNDNSVNETEVGPDGNVISTTTTPVPDGCTQPGHAVYFTDSEGLKLVATCYGSGNYFVANSVLGGNSEH
ncbi:MAG: hypothetical protein ACRER1_04050 [Gammaproteobacteria bacterium]